jgi:tRNA (guanine37-N1)-methyltransferase
VTSDAQEHLQWLTVVSLFPEMFSPFREMGVIGRAFREHLVALNIVNPRDFTEDRHRTVDDRPFGGGPGMLMKIDPLARALQHAREQAAQQGLRPKVVYLSPAGERLNQGWVDHLASQQALILLCGRYEGVDERLIASEVDWELSVGDFVVSGGELPAMMLADAVLRRVPGVLGHADSAQADSFADGLLDCPHYTRPAVYGDRNKVPEVLLSGDHQAIERWRRKQALGRTWLRRPDLLVNMDLTESDKQLLQEFLAESGDSTERNSSV